MSRALRGELNRVLNAESANLQRAVAAAGRQLDAIAVLDADGRLPEQPYVVRLDRRRAPGDARGHPHASSRSASTSIARPSSARSNASSAWPRRSRRRRARRRSRHPRAVATGWRARMRDVVIAANWKMHTTPADAGDLARTIASRTREPGVTRVICPPYRLPRGGRRGASPRTIRTSAVGAQNVHHELAGAYTGEVSAPMLVGLATWVIVGHSERRRDAARPTSRSAASSSGHWTRASAPSCASGSSSRTGRRSCADDRRTASSAVASAGNDPAEAGARAGW